VNGQFHTPASFSPVKKLKALTGWRPAGAHDHFGRFVEEKNILPLQGIDSSVKSLTNVFN
jgi:hypothetical protein